MSTEFKGGFAEAFPFVNFRTLAATFCFYIPLYRDMLLYGGVVDAARYSARLADWTKQLAQCARHRSLSPYRPSYSVRTPVSAFSFPPFPPCPVATF